MWQQQVGTIRMKVPEFTPADTGDGTSAFLNSFSTQRAYISSVRSATCIHCFGENMERNEILEEVEI